MSIHTNFANVNASTSRSTNITIGWLDNLIRYPGKREKRPKSDFNEIFWTDCPRHEKKPIDFRELSNCYNATTPEARTLY